MAPEEKIKSEDLEQRENPWLRVSSISQIVMLYGSGGTLLFMTLFGVCMVYGHTEPAFFFIYIMTGCMVAFFLGVAAYIFTICFGTMKFTLRGLLTTTLLLGLSAALATSTSYVLFILGLLLGNLVVLYWVYRFFKASFEQDRRDGMV